MPEGLERLAAYWHALRCLDPEQIPARLRYRLVWRLYPRMPAVARLVAEPPARGCRPRPGFAWPGDPPAYRAIPGPRPASLLWQFHQHYFDWAPFREREALAAEAGQWMQAYPPGSWPAWHPYPTSLRIVNWIRAFGAAMPAAVARSLAAQTAFLEQNLEFHLGGNHLLENARALLAAGCFFEGHAAGRWAALGLSLLRRELKRQVLGDGGHYERSPYYHLRMTQLVQDAIALLRAAGRPVPPELTRAGEVMTAFASALRHLDGSVPSFHDAVFPSRPELPAGGPSCFPESGYYILDNACGRLIADYGAPGCHPNPAHQHAGIFSFEVSTPEGLVIADAGTATYDPGPDRERLRSTAAHNTIRIDGRDQFQVWGVFRVGRRASVSPVQHRRGPDYEAVTASHDGYRTLRVAHRRTIASLHEQGWLIVDDLTGSGSPREIESFLHLAPAVRPVLERECVRLEPLGWTVRPFGFRSRPEILEDRHAPGIGLAAPALTLVFRAALKLPCRCGFYLGPEQAKNRIGSRLDDLQLKLGSSLDPCSA